MIVLGESKIEEQLERAVTRANKLIEKQVDTDADELKREIDAAAREDAARGCGPGGRGFESRRSPSLNPCKDDSLPEITCRRWPERTARSSAARSRTIRLPRSRYQSMYLPHARASGMSRPRSSKRVAASVPKRTVRSVSTLRRAGTSTVTVDGSPAGNQPPGSGEHGLIRQIGRDRSVEGSRANAQRDVAEVTQRDVPRPCGEIQRLSPRVAVLHVAGRSGGATAIGRTPRIPEADYGLGRTYATPAV